MERKSKRKSHTREFKLEAVKRSYEVGKTVAEVARELDVREMTCINGAKKSLKKAIMFFPVPAGEPRTIAANLNT